MKEIAQSRGIPVSHDLSWLESHEARKCVAVVVAYGRIIPANIVDSMPMVNVHFSLLPRWRGAAPVERAIIAGDAMTGVSLMRLDSGLDTGPVYASAATPILPTETAEELTERLARMGGEELATLLSSPLPEPAAQKGDATYATKIRATEGELVWDEPADLIVRKVRALRAFTWIHGKRLRILRASGASENAFGSTPAVGSVLKDCLVRAGTGYVRLEIVQAEGRAPTPAMDWLRGIREAHPVFDWPRVAE